MSEVDDTTPVEYRVSEEFPEYRGGTDGSVWSCKVGGRWKRLKPRPIKGGYFSVALYRDGERFGRLIQRFILETFIGPCPDGMEACHIDHNPANNAPSNLEWGTHRTNMSQMTSAERQSRGESHSKSVLSEDDVIQIRRMYVEGATTKELSARFGIAHQNIQGIVVGRLWKHVAMPSGIEDMRQYAIANIRRGTREAAATLKSDDVLEIRKLLAAAVPKKDIASRYGVSARAIQHIDRGTTWSDVV